MSILGDLNKEPLSVPATLEEIAEMALEPEAFSIVVGEIGNEQGRVACICFSLPVASQMLDEYMFDGSWGKINYNGQTIERRTR